MLFRAIFAEKLELTDLASCIQKRFAHRDADLFLGPVWMLHAKPGRLEASRGPIEPLRRVQLLRGRHSIEYPLMLHLVVHELAIPPFRAEYARFRMDSKAAPARNGVTPTTNDNLIHVPI